MKLEVLEKTESFRCGAYGPVAVTVWEAAAVLSDAASAIRVLDLVAKREPNIMLLAILGSGAPPAGAELRDSISGAIRRLKSQVRAAASVVEGEGFRAAAMRGALIGMGFMVRQGHPHKIYATLDEAADFLATQDDRVSARALSAAVRQMREP